MERKLLIIATLFLWGITAAFLVVFLMYPNIHELALADHQKKYASEAESVLYRMRDEFFLMGDEEIGGHNLRLEIPSNVNMEKVEINEDVIEKKLSIKIPGIDEGYFNDFPMVGSSSRISEITYSNIDQIGTIDITLNSIYSIDRLIEDRFLYLDFARPKTKYDYVVVIDAGHGGKDVGAITKGEYEKDINLEMLTILKNIFDKEDSGINIGVLCTRTTDKFVSLEDRVGLANEANADLFVSIHQNSTASGRQSDINGTEVMYKSSDKTEGSKKFGQKCLARLLADLESTNKGLVAGDEIFIIRQANMPVALAEVGFMTNREELRNLKNPSYQEKAMHAIYDAVVEELSEGE